MYLGSFKNSRKRKKESYNWNDWFYQKTRANDKKFLKKNSYIKSWEYEFGGKFINVSY